ncbi:MAG: FKBP-type peptidyl-prolyl cis-trans isomerase [bacterium]|nr:FKBP-type peptidyl-prolyl cis-trans isomerase [bacterium]MDN5835007.1 FKBP-type peptidyl-prolyl cis-trans isomerase [bacterium]
MATKKSQRIAIWVIAVALTVGTLGSFLVMALAGQNEQRDQARLQEAYQEYQSKVQAQSDELSKKYYPVLHKFEDLPAKFDAKSVKKLAIKDLKAGSGDKISEGDSFAAYYIGWTPSGEVFESSIEGDKLGTPFNVTQGSGVIEGWVKGLDGIKTGGVRLLTIPSDQAYGDQASDKIPANSPLKFVIMAVPQPKEIPIPEILLEQQAGQQPY